MIRSRRLAAVLMAFYLVLVAWIVFLPTSAVASSSVGAISTLLHAVGFPAWVAPAGVEAAANVLLFVPAGFLARTFRPHWRWWHWLAAGLAGTLSIEATQLVFLTDRSAQLMDVVANTVGAVVGYGVSIMFERTAQDRIPR